MEVWGENRKLNACSRFQAIQGLSVHALCTLGVTSEYFQPSFLISVLHLPVLNIYVFEVPVFSLPSPVSGTTPLMLLT